jgi:hypothetical protein
MDAGKVVAVHSLTNQATVLGSRPRSVVRRVVGRVPQRSH